MVSFVNGDLGSEAAHKRRRVNGASPLTEALTSVQPRKLEARHRKQKLMSKMSDSGFEEDLVGLSPISSPARTNVSPLRVDEPEPPADSEQQLSNWYRQYGDVGFTIQREKEAQFHPCRSLARQPQVGYKTLHKGADICSLLVNGNHNIKNVYRFVLIWRLVCILLTYSLEPIVHRNCCLYIITHLTQLRENIIIHWNTLKCIIHSFPLCGMNKRISYLIANI